MFRFIHSSDLHLGKRFGNFSGDLPSRLREARHAVIAKLAHHAREQGATTILLAGDTFDSETPAPDVRRQALAEMRDHPQLRWIIMPGNHDSLQATHLWTTLNAEKSDNVVLALEAKAVELAKNVVLLPAPCTTRRPGRDLTEWMDTESTPEGAIRIGIAHGAIRNFSEESNGADIIAPDRAQRAGLDYLALGDWHGGIEVDSRTRYSGTPEQDQFKHERQGEALLVDIAGTSAIPSITPLPTATFTWQTLNLHLLENDDTASILDMRLPASKYRRHTLARIVATGRSSLTGHTTLMDAIKHAMPDFAFFELDNTGLTTECEAMELDQIDRNGALREAANALFTEANNENLSLAERDIAKAALTRLFSYTRGSTL